MKYPSASTAHRRGLLRHLVAGAAIGLLLALAGAAMAGPKFLDEAGEGDFDLTGNLQVKNASALNASVVFNYQDNRDHYLLSLRGNRAALALIRGGRTRPLGVPATLDLKSGQTVPFTLQRRDWRMAFVLDNRVVLRAYDSTLQDGKVGCEATGGTWVSPRIQPVGDIIVEDDFVREEGAQSVWQPVMGNWQQKTLRNDEQAAREEPEKSANAFSYLGSGEPHGITLAGDWFWDRYRLQTAAKPLGNGAVGLVFYYQDDNNYMVMRWSSAAAGGANGDKVQLLAVRHGKSTVVAERSGGYVPKQWYNLRVEVCDGIVQCAIDNQQVLRARCADFGQGQVGLYVEGKHGAFFDDVVCTAWEQASDDFSTSVPGKWQGSAAWIQRDGEMVYNGSRPELCTTGRDWQKYICGMDTRPTSDGGVGLAFAYRSPRQYCLLRWAPASARCSYHGHIQLVQVTDKGQQVLAERALPAGGAERRVKVSVDEGIVTGQLDNGSELQAAAPGVDGGAIGLYADGKATFDNMFLELITPQRSSHVTKEFAITNKHPEMSEWASPTAAWVKPPSGQDVWWTKGDYFGDTTVAFKIPDVGSRAGSAKAVIGGEPDTNQGLTLTITATRDSKQLALALTGDGKPLGSGKATVDQDADIRFSREDHLVVVRVNDAIALCVPDPTRAR